MLKKSVLLRKLMMLGRSQNFVGGRGKYIYPLSVQPKPIDSYTGLVADTATWQIGPVLLNQLVFDCKYLSCKICLNMLNYVFIFIFLLFSKYQQHCHNSGRYHM